MILTLIRKIKSFFSRHKSAAIPFAEHSRAATRHISLSKQKPKDEKPVPEKRTPEPDARMQAQPKPVKPPRKPPWSLSDYPVEPSEGRLRFHDLNLPVQIMHAIADLGFKYCTPVQAGILPEALSGKDAIGQAQTGTGKSAAFLITILTHMIRNPFKGGPPKGKPRALILAPTRELVLQIEKDALGLCKYTPFKILSVFGGIGYEKQMKSLKERSFDIIVATPGRLIDFKNKHLISLEKIEILVLDEADRMLDMGFIPDVRKIVYSTPHKDKRQTFFYSATFTPEVTRLAEQWTRNPCIVEIEPEHVAADTVKQMIYITTTKEKFPLLYNLITKEKLERVLVFTNRRDQARNLAKKLNNYNVKSALISGEVHQNKRIKALEGFRNSEFRVLVATDVAARGIHIDDISHVINYNLPQDPENYVHRIGRTGRAGMSGISVSFACEDDSFHIPDIEAFLGNDLVCEYPDESYLDIPPEPEKPANTSDNAQKPRRRRPRRPNRPKQANAERSSGSSENGNGIESGPEKPRRSRPSRNRRRKPRKPAGKAPVSSNDS